ncbi:MAG: DUF3341 domain-containing protein [Verrucomicrobia bacterium]|nr:DUF3341 domain-containing protein [Verrucomicrobiota bacterium]
MEKPPEPEELAEIGFRAIERGAPRGWGAAAAICAVFLALGTAATTRLLLEGLGLWGLNQPVMWGWAIVNFVWWIGIGHAGTFISAILRLMRQPWRTSIHRTAETATLLAVLCAAAFPLIHLGRAWFAWWLAPVHNANALWPQFRSPLMWDVFAIGTYFTVSLLFWHLGLLPDLAMLRDRTRSRRRRRIYGLLALGWRGTMDQWRHYEKTVLILAGLATALVISVHSIVSLDFAASQLPGWHSTIFPPYFVAGAIFSGCAMTLTILIPIRRWCGLEKAITLRHIDALCKATLAMGLMVAYAYLVEIIAVPLGADAYERSAFWRRVAGPCAPQFLAMIFCNALAPQLFWFRAVRRNPTWAWIVAVLINVGMWLERWGIVVGALGSGFLPADWGGHRATWIDALTFLGSLGFFGLGILLFVRFLPAIGISETAAVTAEEHDERVPAPDRKARRRAEPASDQAPPPPEQAAGAWAGRFSSEAEALEALRRLEQEGRRPELICPYPPKPPREERFGRTPIGWWAMAGAAAGAALGFALVWYANAYDYPLLVGGKPMFHWAPALPIAFELAILLGAFGAAAGFVHHAGLGRSAAGAPLLPQPDRWILLAAPEEADSEELIKRRLRELGAEATARISAG